MQANGAAKLNDIGVIVNPRAGKKPAAATWRQALPGAQVAETAGHASLGAVIGQMHERGIKLLVSVGGDGTFSQVLTAACKAWKPQRRPAVLPVAAGTMNMIAMQLGWGQAPADTAAWLAQAGPSVSTRAVRSLVSDSGQVGFTAGVGVPVRFLQAYSAGGPSKTRAIRQLARFGASALLGGGAAEQLFAPISLQWGEAEADNVAHWTVALVTRIDALPLGFRVAPGASTEPQLHVLCGAPSARQVVRLLPALHRGAALSGTPLQRRRVDRLHLAFDQPTAWMMDGELLPPVTALTLSDGPLLQVPRRR